MLIVGGVQRRVVLGTGSQCQVQPVGDFFGAGDGQEDPGRKDRVEKAGGITATGIAQPMALRVAKAEIRLGLYLCFLLRTLKQPGKKRRGVLVAFIERRATQ